ncbi:ATPase [Skermanella mucosa]|uniref:F0F1 ATP synthase subunit B family protein n=1 Tax=Skermanella mucosa TaxID=1789672 RepID=UPI00192B54F0|nr:ATPase [Skermanella mucosa]UEM21875.1 ATPase [Skermanella mucosa]
MPKFLARLRAGRLAGRAGLAWTMLVVTAGGALAQADHGAAGDAAHGADMAHGAEHASGGLPQLDPTVFAPQLIWLAISFIALYFLMAKVALPKVAEVLEERQERITNDLDRASALREESAGVMEGYEKALTDARAHAQSVMAATTADIASASSGRQAQFNADLAAKTRAAEERINAAKETALTSVRSVAVEIAQQAAEKLGGIKVDAARADTAVGAVMQERG